MSSDASTSSPLPSREEVAADRALAFVQRLGDGAARAARDTWHVLRFVIFVLYMVLAIVSIWIWLIEAVIGAIRMAVRAVMIVLLWLSGGIAPRPGAPPASIAESIRRDLRYFWAGRIRAYDRVARNAAGHIVNAQRATRTFWHWPIGRQVFSLGVALIFIGVPLLYVIPRPHYVQVTDDNAIHHSEDGKKVIYLVHAVDLFDRDKTREYMNEDAVYLGKVDSQGLKSKIVPGRYYRLWVVGIRWWKYPRLFPNIIQATEVDAEGNTVSDPSRHLIAGQPKAP